jgi:hypothetical protein
MRWTVLFGLAAWVVGFAAAATAAPAAKPAHKPSIEGLWAHNYILVFESPANAPGLVVTGDAEAKTIAATEIKQTSEFFIQGLDPEVPALLAQSDGLPVVRGERRSRILVEPADGKLPYRPQVRAQLSGPPPPDPPNAFDDPERRPNAERCLVGIGQPPLSSLSFAWVLQILKTPGAVAIHAEYGDDVRVVPITDKHGPKTFISRLGDSIGHWEDDTLVVETIGMPAGDSFRLAPMVLISEAAVVTERFTPVSDKELLYQFTVNDPKLYTAPWRAEFSWHRTKKQMYEHACHEGNYSLSDELAGARYLERTAKAATAAGTR